MQNYIDKIPLELYNMHINWSDQSNQLERTAKIREGGLFF